MVSNDTHHNNVMMLTLICPFMEGSKKKGGQSNKESCHLHEDSSELWDKITRNISDHVQVYYRALAYTDIGYLFSRPMASKIL